MLRVHPAGSVAATAPTDTLARVTGPNQYSIAGLFAGIGGIEAGLGQNGGESEIPCESWDPARRVLAARFPEVPIIEDVRDLRSLPKVDVLTAGFPCTDLSQARFGSQPSLGLDRKGSDSRLVRFVTVLPICSDPPVS